jgi:hypothetical protein
VKFSYLDLAWLIFAPPGAKLGFGEKRMLLIFLAAICITFPVAFVLGWRMAMRRRANLKAVAVHALHGSGKVHWQWIDPAEDPPPPKIKFGQIDSAQEGVVAFYNKWRSKWHGP